MYNSQLNINIKKIPVNSGIYMFKTTSGKYLYIGKALNLKNRINDYLKIKDPRLSRMIQEADKISFVETKNDIEALILESRLIKKHRPDFNIMLRDDKQFGFVGFTKERWPKVFITHQPTKQRSSAVVSSEISKKNSITTALQPDFIGPFTDIGALKITLRYLRRVFPYCTCRQLHNNYCLNYHIDKCIGDCCLKKPSLKLKAESLKQYNNNIKSIKDILSGKKSSLIKQLEKEMKSLSQKQEYEKALELQYKIGKLKHVFQNAKIINKDPQPFMIYHKGLGVLKSLQNILNLSSPPYRIECYDIANIQGKHAVGAMVVFLDGKPDKKEYRKFKIHMFGFTTSKHTGGDVGMLREVITRRFNHPEWKFPDLIIVDGGKQQLNAVESVVNHKLQVPNYKQISNSKSQIPIIALTKSEKHIGYKVIMQNNNEMLLSKMPIEVKNLLLQIDIKAHRFAISYYRQLHRKNLNSMP